MKLSVLLLSTASRWLGTARMARVLAKAGFDVVLLAPVDSLAAHSRYVSTLRFLPDNAIPLEWLLAMIGVVNEVSPRLIVPCDEMAIRLLFSLTLEPPPGLTPAVRARLDTLIRDSLGEPAFYAASIDKTLLPAAAADLGVRVPPHFVAEHTEQAPALAAALGYPVVLKRSFGFAGQGVAVVSTLDELVRHAHALLRPDQLDLGQGTPRLLVQKFIRGVQHAQAMVSWHGNPLAAFAWERYHATQPVKGQTTVVRFVESPETREFTERLVRGLGITGFFNVQYMVHADTGEAYLLEINRRIVSHMHMGDRVGVDLGVALYRHLTGVPLARPEAPSGFDAPIVTVFPREWLRDPCSRDLHDYPVDVPWDDPELLGTLLATRHDARRKPDAT